MHYLVWSKVKGRGMSCFKLWFASYRDVIQNISTASAGEITIIYGVFIDSNHAVAGSLGSEYLSNTGIAAPL